MNLDALIAKVSPGWAVKRAQARQDLQRYYDAAQSSNYHKAVRGGGNSADSVNQPAVRNLRSWARYLDENHDLAIGIFDNIVNRVCGAGLTIEPTVKTATGTLDEQSNDTLRDLWTEFWRRPEVTGELPGGEVERLLCRAWMRDGEALTKHVIGTGPAIRHNSRVPYSIEMLESDFLPMDLNGDNITNGVEKNQWGRPVAYHIYKAHPGSQLVPFQGTNFQTKRVSAELITHLKFTRRFRQTRGVSIIHGIIRRLDGIKDYEESELIAARVAAAFTSYIKRSPDYQGTVDADGNVPMEMQSGMIFDGLGAGEELGSIGTDRPNTNLGTFRNDMMRAAASGTGTNASSISKNYDGTYSSQRQEMVEAVEGYKKLLDCFVDVQMMPTWKFFIDMAVTARLFIIPAGVTLQQLYTAVDMRGPGVPWVDPKKEVEADAIAVEKGFKSRHQLIRERGGDPRLVDRELEADTFTPATEQPAPAPPADEETDDDETIDETDTDDAETEAA